MGQVCCKRSSDRSSNNKACNYLEVGNAQSREKGKRTGKRNEELSKVYRTNCVSRTTSFGNKGRRNNGSPSSSANRIHKTTKRSKCRNVLCFTFLHAGNQRFPNYDNSKYKGVYSDDWPNDIVVRLKRG